MPKLAFPGPSVERDVAKEAVRTGQKNGLQGAAGRRFSSLIEADLT
jgi:hypothetical protein